MVKTLPNITLRQLRYFEAVAKHKHFGHAADACAVSQPALSVQIKELETALGAQLFERSPRHVQLTALGQMFEVRVHDIIQSVDELGQLARAAQATLSGRLRVGIIPTIAPYLLPALIRQLAVTHPQIDLHVRETVTPRLLQELDEGRLDTAILALPTGHSGFTETVLFEESLILVRPLTQAQTPVPPKEHLADMRLLLLEEGHCFRDQTLSFCSLGGAAPRDGLDGSSLSTLVQMVGAGIGVTLIPEMAVAVETSSAAVCVGHFPDPQPKRTVGMVWRKTNPMAPHLHKLADIVRQAALDDRQTPL